MDKNEEYILCAAIHYRDGMVYNEQPIGIKSGLVVAGYRHGNCVQVLETLVPDYKPELAAREAQGFLTSKNRFVSRAEGYQIALKQNQLLLGPCDAAILTSEDLYWPKEPYDYER